MLSRFARPTSTLARMFSYSRSYATAIKTDDEIMQEIKNALQRFDNSDEAVTVTEDSNFVEDYGLDSLDIIELILEIEDKLNIEIPDDDAVNIVTVNDAVLYIKKQLAEKKE